MLAIETSFHGYRFRSRLEARWAVFFDALSLRWEFESEGYDLDGVRYLPDFWLPDHGTWIEIKPDYPDFGARTKLHALADAANRRVFCLVGVPSLDDHDDGRHIAIWPGDETWSGPEDYGYRWCACTDCDTIGIEFMGRAERLSCGHAAEYRPGEKTYTHDHARIAGAVNAARAARFGT